MGKSILKDSSKLHGYSSLDLANDTDLLVNFNIYITISAIKCNIFRFADWNRITFKTKRPEG